MYMLNILPIWIRSTTEMEYFNLMCISLQKNNLGAKGEAVCSRH